MWRESEPTGVGTGVSAALVLVVDEVRNTLSPYAAGAIGFIRSRGDNSKIATTKTVLDKHPSQIVVAS